ncbi:MAG: replication initiator protein A [Colwellia sp.]|jgi:Plasmid replication initiator protein
MSDLIAIDQIDMFVADIVDVTPKSDENSMSLPIFAVSSKPDTDKYRYENKETGDWIEIIPSADGRATIHDKDLLIYAFSQMAEASNQGREISRRIRIQAYSYLTSTGKGTDGKSYKAIGDTLARLRGTTVRTNSVNTEDKLSAKTEVYGLIDYGSAITDRKGRLVHFDVVISVPFFNAVNNREIIEYNRKYFSIRSPYERRLYELSRQKCGEKDLSWEPALEDIWHIYGVKSPLKEFRRKIKGCVKKQNIPDYFLEYKASKTPQAPDYLVVMYDPGNKRANRTLFNGVLTT